MEKEKKKKSGISLLDGDGLGERGEKGEIFRYLYIIGICFYFIIDFIYFCIFWRFLILI